MQFKIKDPRGNTITCARNTWNNHIVPNHPDLSTKQNIVERAIRNPTRIYSDAQKTDRECYYRIEGNKYMKVVVNFTGVHEGEVITAFFSPGQKNSETLLWQRNYGNS